jgi:hypothetical protein
MSKDFFASHSFHDNFIHGLSYADEDFESVLTLDIDYIQEWRCTKQPIEFVVSPAWLTFNDVRAYSVSLRRSEPVSPAWLTFNDVRAYSVSLRRSEPTLNSYLGIILGVESESLGEGLFRYTFSLVGENRLEIEAGSVELTVRGTAVTSDAQQLSLAQRAAGPGFPTAG